ncbi:MAG TPA: aspartate aminotransferase family protein [Candidatus Limnocylindria bacterium]|nr:aspartate aminotransferase family protein [Candidatus Limnocylindria bacterium]
MKTAPSKITREQVTRIRDREEAEYRRRTPRSAALHERARQSMPLGVASSFQAYSPYPLFMTDARGSRIWDADGNEYVDFDMAFGVLAAGHSHPILAEVLRERVANGTCYTFPVEDGVVLAEEIKRRFGADLVRFSNSGTEATMDAIRVARGYTGREKIVKFEGGYHGHHDDVLVSIQPPRELMGAPDAPATVPASAGLPRSRMAETVVAPYNEPKALETILERHRGEIAAILIEPVQFNIGVVPPLPGYLERVRELATEHGAVLIFDEVKTGVVLAYGGATEWFGVKPDLFCLAKSIGGGVPIGAFGGRGEVMSVIETLEGTQHYAGMGGSLGTGVEQTTISGGATRVAHLGTFNGNPLSMAAGVAVLTRILTPDVYPSLHAMADRLTAGCQQVVDDFGLPGYAINTGPKGCVMFTPERVTNYRDFIGLDGELWEASFFYLANRGILLPPGPDDQWTLSVQHTDDEIDRYVATFREFAAELTG